jgi:hypothetical protein
MRRVWTDEEEMILRAMVRFASLREIGERLGRTPASIKHKLEGLGLRASDFRVVSRVSKERVWTERELRILRESAGKKTSEEISGLLVKRSSNAVKLKASELGLVLQKGAWTSEDLDNLLILRDRGLTWKQIGVELGRTWVSCRRKHEYLTKP